jgi:hypothetical protein
VAESRLYKIAHYPFCDFSVACFSNGPQPDAIIQSAAHNFSIMTSRMPPVPPDNRSNKGTASSSNTKSEEKSVKHEHHRNAAEEGETANIKQNATNKGYFHGRRIEK